MSNIQDLFGVADCTFNGIENWIDKDDREYAKLNFTYAGEVPDVCSRCGTRLHKHGSRHLKAVDTPHGGQPAVYDVVIPRKRCPDCKTIWQPIIKGINERHQMTDRAYFAIAQRSLQTTFEDVTNDYMLTANTIKNTFVEYLEEYKGKLRFRTPVFMGIDEIKINKLGMITVITDLEHHTMYDILPGRKKTDLVSYFSELPNREDVLWVCSDMYRPFETSIKECLPNAQWAIDYFHVVMKANEALDDVRKKIQAELPKKERINTKKGIAYTVRKRLKEMDAEEKELVKTLRQHEKYRPIAIAFDLKEDFFNIYDENPASKENAMDAFAIWKTTIPDDKIYDGFRKLAKTVHNHYEQIFKYWDCPIAISNGYTECANRLIREDNIRGRGHSFEVLRGRTLYRKSNLESMMNQGILDYGPVLEENEANFRFDSTKDD